MMAKTLVVGLGSPHGNDQIGWLVADRLAAYRDPIMTVSKANSPIDVGDWLDGIDYLVVCDACHSGHDEGVVRRLEWPCDEMETTCFRGTHDLGLPGTLQVLANLGKLPAKVTIWAVEVAAPCKATAATQGVVDLASKVAGSIRESLNHA